METIEGEAKETEPVRDIDAALVAPYTLLYITRAYNRKEITFEEWLRQSREWAEEVIRQFGKAE